MNIKLLITKIVLLLLLLSSCGGEDNENIASEFVVAFKSSDASFISTETSKEIALVFSFPATESGTITITNTETDVVYGEDYTINSETDINSEQIILVYNEGDTEVNFSVEKLKFYAEGADKLIDFSISEISNIDAITRGNITFSLSFTEVATLGAVISPKVGGANQPNQVYVDLSLQSQKVVQRDAWDLGFYAGDEFAVKINGSIFMGAAILDATDLNSISESDVADLKELVITGAADTAEYFNDPAGDITQTAIGTIFEKASENKVYLLKLGSEISDETPPIGSVDLSGDVRGWKKIRVIREGGDYVLQYADLNDTSYQEISISKDSDFNFTFFSFNTESVVTIEPEKERWDLNFTVFTNLLDFGDGSYGGYGFSDFIVTNIYGGVNSYQVSKADYTYDGFSESDIDDSLFTENPTTIGSNWRSVFTRLTLSDRFYIVKDTEGNIYKLRFNAVVSDGGERGNPSFDYTKIND